MGYQSNTLKQDTIGLGVNPNIRREVIRKKWSQEQTKESVMPLLPLLGVLQNTKLTAVTNKKLSTGPCSL